MVFNNGQSEKLVESLEKSKNYLIKNSKSEAGYEKLINQLDRKIDFLRENRKLGIKLVSTSSDLVLKLKAKSEANTQLRSLYSFEAVFPFKNIPKIVKNCSAIFAIFRSNQTITQHHHKFFAFAAKKNISLYILVVRSKSNNPDITLAEYIKSQHSLNKSHFSLPINTFVDLDDLYNIKSFQQFLIERVTTLHSKFIQDNHNNIIRDIEHFFDSQNVASWRAIKEIKKHYLQEREVHNYQQQVLTKTFSKINQAKQNKIIYIKQKINQLKSEYLNPFMPNSWIFELQQIIEQSQIKLVKEKSETYLYPIINNGDRSEYLHSYILNLYQQQVIDTLSSQWSKINYVYADGGLDRFINKTNEKIEAIDLVNSSEKELPKIILNPEPFPELTLSKIIDPKCLQINSKLVFDYNFTQSTWFKLLMSSLIGITIYLVTKAYFGEGKYIGFFILFVQIINIITGQSAKKTRLKSHKKELQRILNNKYQILTRLIVEQMTQTLIISLDKKNKEINMEIDAIAELAQEKLDRIRQDIEQHHLRKNKLGRDRKIIKDCFSYKRND